MKVFCREHALAYPQPQIKTCGGLEAFITTSLCRKCGGTTGSEGLEHYILKTHLELHYPFSILFYLSLFAFFIYMMCIEFSL